MAENTERLVRELQDLRSTKVIQTLSSDTRLLAEHASSTQRRPPGASGRPPTAGAMNVSVADWTPLSRQRSDSNTSDPKHQTLYDGRFISPSHILFLALSPISFFFLFSVPLFIYMESILPRSI